MKEEAYMKKIVVISSSPRKNGNSEILADQFIKGATSGTQSNKINLANYRRCSMPSL